MKPYNSTRYFKQDRIISELAKMTDARIVHYDGTGEYKTTQVMYNAGICACSVCGYMQPIEVKMCGSCREDLCIVMAPEETTQVTELRKVKPLKLVKGETKLIKKNTYV